MNTAIQIFTSEVFGEIRTCQVNNQIMFVGSDVAKALGYTNTQKAIRDHVDHDDKLTERFVLSGQGRSVIIINESGLYSLILSSKLPQAKAFKHWVTAEVLPQIRKTGGYIPTRDASGRELSSKEILERADAIVGRTLKFLNEPAEDTLTATQVAKTFNMTTLDFNAILRDSSEQKQTVAAIRSGNEALKHRLEQMNYSCLPNEDGTLKGSTRMSNTVGMDIDHLTAEEMPAVRERILAKKDELGLGMLEESARGKGYHLVFARKPHMSQEENLQWAANLLQVAYDAQAKDITRVFFTTSADQLPPPSLYPRKHRELLRAIVATELNIGLRHVKLADLDAAYSVAFPNSTPINVNKKKKHDNTKRN